MRRHLLTIAALAAFSSVLTSCTSSKEFMPEKGIRTRLLRAGVNKSQMRELESRPAFGKMLGVCNLKVNQALSPGERMKELAKNGEACACKHGGEAYYFRLRDPQNASPNWEDVTEVQMEVWTLGEVTASLR